MSDPVLRARGVARRFGSEVALEPTDVDVQARQALALIGPNGAGKSTLLALLAGALQPSAGTIERVGDVRVGWVPQRAAFYDRLTARENLQLFGRLEGEPDHAAGGVAGGEPWQRLPLLAAGLVVAGAALGALGTLLGALARETRTASLVAVLVVMPVVFLGLVPREVVPVAGWLSDGLPFAHAVRYFSASLYDASPWKAVIRELVWLAGLGLVFGALARVATRRLLA